MPELDMVSIVLLEIGMIIGGIVGFLVVIRLQLRKIVIIRQPESPHEEEEDDLIDLDSYVPEKKVSFIENDCNFEGKDPESVVRENRSHEDDSYRILKRRLKKHHL